MVNREARDEDREARNEERVTPPRPPPDMQAQMLVGMMEFFAQYAGNQATANAGARPRPEDVYERFRRMDPKEFSGTTDPMDADQVRCATFLLSGDARRWWETNDVREKDVRVAGPTTYAVVVSRALAAEQDQRDIENDRQGKRPYQAPQQHQQQLPQFKRPYQRPPKGKGPISQQKAPKRPDNFPYASIYFGDLGYKLATMLEVKADRDRVSCTVFILVKAARIWWEATKVTVNVRELKWNEFKELFYANYFSREVKAKKVKEFLELRQDSLSVADYTLKFEEGCVFVPFIVENDKDKGEHLLRGLKPEIRRDVHMAKVITYQDIVERALLAEHDEQEIEKERQLRRQSFQARGQGTSASTRGGHKGKGKMEQRNKPSAPSSDMERSLCPKCGKTHKGECQVGSGRCYRCKKMGHTTRKCPLSSDKVKVQGRIFTMTKEGANPDSSVISGNILISGKEALTLIDTGATHSFMSEVFMHFLSREPTVMPLHFTIMLPSGDEICPTSILKACPVQMGTRLLYADFIMITMVAFDVILGMDWLSAYRAVIDCVGKIVKFLTNNHESDEIVGLGSSISTPIISCLQAIKLLNNGCTSFLALVSDVNMDSNVQLQNIDVVQEYPDVFVDDVPGLPPDREVEFVIELSPGTAPISKTPYRMAPTEMKELKNQMQKLLDKGFIRPSSSPWGAPVLFVKKKDGSFRCFNAGVRCRVDATWESDRLCFLQLKEYEKNYPTHDLELAAKELNMRQRRWLELVKGYDCTISYHPGKANVVTDALSRKSSYLLGSMIQKPLLLDLQRNKITLVSPGTVNQLSALVLHSTLIDRILKEQQLDLQLLELKNKSDLTGVSDFGLNSTRLLTFRGRICIPVGDDIRKDVLIEDHSAPYSVHPGSTKMYQDLRRLYWWLGMKKYIMLCISECLICQQVKIEHQRPAATLLSLPIPQWKWEHITMDFVTGLQRTPKGYNSIWVIVDRLTKSTHFLQVKTTFTINQYAAVYVAEIVRLHGIPVSIVSDLVDAYGGGMSSLIIVGWFEFVLKLDLVEVLEWMF
ncbi:uncharacterized protein [Primulina huaijiensis]|uniref:uncharacterized protein n=1 Tax=Primulina huaijiensis TaxID=1492673 RepID=UPI003CC71B5E